MESLSERFATMKCEKCGEAVGCGFHGEETLFMVLDPDDNPMYVCVEHPEYEPYGELLLHWCGHDLPREPGRQEFK